MPTTLITWIDDRSEMSFSELNQLDTNDLLARLTDESTSDDNYKRIVYEIRIRSIELPEKWKLNNN